MIVLKLLVILIFLLFSSKSFGILINKKTSLSHEISLGLGYMANIVIFFVLSFIPMYFRLSANWMMISGTVYSIICFASLWYSIKNKLLFKFSKKEVLAFVIAVIFTLIFALFLDFGYADLYDSYFYSVLTNSSTKTDKLSMINPYTGISDLQNYYKYMSFYLQSGYFANIFDIAPAYLVLIWPFTFMAYYFMGITALGIVRISKTKHINNMISIFVLTLYTYFFRAPFCHTFIVYVLFPIYLLYFAYKALKDSKNLWLYYLAFAAAAACSSVVLYTSVVFIISLFIASSLKKNYDKLKTVFLLGIPTYLLGCLYLLESNRSILIVSLSLLILLLIWYIIRFDFVKKLSRVVAILLIFIIPIGLILLPSYKEANDDHLDSSDDFSKIVSRPFTDQDEVSDSKIMATDNLCISEKVTIKDLEIDKDYDIFGTATRYMVDKKTSVLNTGVVLITHSIFMYGGLLFFAIYGFKYKRKEIHYIVFVIYFVLFNNPLVSSGLSIVTLNLALRVYLFFNTLYAIYGIMWFFEWVKGFNIKPINKCMKYIGIPYALLLCVSVYSYVSLFKTPDYKNMDILYKLPKNIVAANDEVNEIIGTKLTDEKPIVYFSLDTIGLSMIDKDPNDLYKLVDRRVFVKYLNDNNTLKNKMLLHVYFESSGKYDFDSIKPYIKDGEYDENWCGIRKMLSEYKVDYIVLGSKHKDAYDKIKDSYDIVYDKNDILVLRRSGE